MDLVSGIASILLVKFQFKAPPQVFAQSEIWLIMHLEHYFLKVYTSDNKKSIAVIT